MIPSLTTNNVNEIAFVDLIDAISPFALEEVPEGTGGDPDALTELDRLMGRFANLYGYLIHLWAASSDWMNRYKVMGDTDAERTMRRKKDALWEISRVVKLKYEACSRMITAHVEERQGQMGGPNYQRRQARAEGKKMQSWDTV